MEKFNWDNFVIKFREGGTRRHYFHRMHQKGDSSSSTTSCASFKIVWNSARDNGNCRAEFFHVATPEEMFTLNDEGGAAHKPGTDDSSSRSVCWREWSARCLSKQGWSSSSHLTLLCATYEVKRKKWNGSQRKSVWLKVTKSFYITYLINEKIFVN